MGEPHQVGKIEIDEDLDFLASEWRWQRVGWVVMALILAAALLGALGSGPLSKARGGDPAAFAVEYQRIIRHGATEELRFHVAAGLQSDTAIHIAIARDLLSKQQIESIVPEPAEQSASGNFIVFEFPKDDPRSPLLITIYMKPSGYGTSSGTVELVGVKSLQLRQFILP